MNQLLTEASLKTENQEFYGTNGVSPGNRGNGFIPAFRDSITGRVELSRFRNGQPAPVHLIEGLPECWVVKRDAANKATAITQSVVAGFVRDGYFYTRSQTAELVLPETTL